MTATTPAAAAPTAGAASAPAAPAPTGGAASAPAATAPTAGAASAPGAPTRATPTGAPTGAIPTLVPPDGPLLEGRNLRKTYRLGRHNTLEALRGVDIHVERGEMVAIMGPSGSGKSTLMHILGLLHSPDLDAGHRLSSPGPRPRLTFDGRDVVALGEGERTRIRAREMGFVFQDFNLVPTLTALDNVMLACEYAGAGGPEARAAALEALDLVGLGERSGHRPAELSGGEQQRVAIARALVNRPSLVLADEPTGNLDSARSAEVLALMRTLNRERGQTFILVTHDPEVGGACDRTVRMRDGQIR